MSKAIRWSPEQLAEYQKKVTPVTPPKSVVGPQVTVGEPHMPVDEDEAPKRNKYGSEKVVVDGVTFDSKKEYRRWMDLQTLAKAGEICELNRQVRYILAPSVQLDGRTKPALRYWADFTYYQGRDKSGPLIVEDCKSDITRMKDTYRIKKHLMKSVHGIEILET